MEDKSLVRRITIKQSNDADKVVCRTPTPGKKPTRIDRWKFEVIRKSILKAVPKSGEGVAFRDLTKLVKKQLTAADQKKIGSLMWYTTVVKLELEVRREIRRLKGASPQRLLRT